MNTFPDKALITPQSTIAAVENVWKSLCARKKADVVRGYDKVRKHVNVENNLLVRQAAPMLKTNGSATARELYLDTFLSTITGIPFMGDKTGAPMGVAFVAMKTRFAGLVRPTGAPIDQLSNLISIKDEESVKVEKDSIDTTAS